MIKLFDDFKKFSDGVQFFAPEDENAYKAGKPCKGFGSIRYGEGSVYTGDIYFDGKDYNKLGFGRQDFMLSTIGGLSNDVKKAFEKGEIPFEKVVRRAFYIGEFDYRETGWIYGNGTLFYVDGDNKPKFFVPGFFEGLTKIGGYEGEYDYSLLPDGFTPDMLNQGFDKSVNIYDAFSRKLNDYKNIENMFMGDSYMELWLSEAFAGETFDKVFDVRNNANIGVGGTKFCDWIRFLKKLPECPSPERIFINLGFNDIHSQMSAENVYSNYLTVLKMLRERFLKAEYYLFNVVKAPNFPLYFAEEERFNAMTLASAEELGVHIIDMRTLFEAESVNVNCFHEDAIHPNPAGYAIYLAKVKEIIEK